MKYYVKLEIFIQLGLVKLIFILFNTEPANIYLLKLNNRNNTTHDSTQQHNSPTWLNKGVDINDKQTPLDHPEDESEVKRLLLKL